LKKIVKKKKIRGRKKNSSEPDSNQRPQDNFLTLQSRALPTELSEALTEVYFFIILNVILEMNQIKDINIFENITGLLGSLLIAKEGSIETVNTAIPTPKTAPTMADKMDFSAQFSIKMVMARSSGLINGINYINYGE
jgi:hypothetical protein